VVPAALVVHYLLTVLLAMSDRLVHLALYPNLAVACATAVAALVQVFLFCQIGAPRSLAFSVLVRALVLAYCYQLVA